MLGWFNACSDYLQREIFQVTQAESNISELFKSSFLTATSGLEWGSCYCRLNRNRRIDRGSAQPEAVDYLAGNGPSIRRARYSQKALRASIVVCPLSYST